MKYIINRILLIVIVFLTLSYITFRIVYVFLPPDVVGIEAIRWMELNKEYKLSLDGILPLLIVYIPLLILYFITSDAPQKKFSDEYIIKSPWE